MKWLVGCTAAMCVRALEFLTTEKQGSVGVTDIEVGGVEVSSLIYYLTSEGKTGVFFLTFLCLLHITETHMSR